YAQPHPTAIRSPCPLLNALANHGYLPRDGRSFHQAELSAALKKVGLSRALRLLDTHGELVLDLDQIGLPGFAEHDISLTRGDAAQGDHLKAQPDLLQGLLASSSDGGRTMTTEDFACLRKRRIEVQKKDNPGLLYGPLQYRISCAEIAFGDGNTVPWEYVRALFVEERLPVKEGWKPRRWWHTLGFWELSRTSIKVAQLVGVKFK
ncbi:putative peroxidase, partial [Triangularia verruculosa]